MSRIVDDLIARAQAAGDEAALAWKDGAIPGRRFWDGVAGRAESLSRSGVAQGDRVAIWLPKGPATVETLFAVMINGAIAVPIDPGFPAARATAVLGEIGPAMLVTDGKRRDMLAGGAVERSRVVVTDAMEGSEPGGDPLARKAIGEDDPAMILMTSGSTGTPKGIVLTHGNLAAFSDWAIGQFGLTREDRFFSLAPLHFDLSLLDVLTSQRLGASVYLVGETEALFPGPVAMALERQRATVFYSVPTTLQRLLSHGGLADRDLGALRWLLFAGEVFPAPVLAALMEAVPEPGYANLYGPTETNVVSCKLLDAAPELGEKPNVGLPCPHSDISIRDEHGNKLATGETGEICVAGPTVTQGYWRRPDLTASAFSDAPDRLYHTGDYGYFDEAGDLRYLGRRDRQAKLRGYRVELEEVELTAMDTGLVEGAVATVADGALCLHVVAHDPKAFAPSALTRALAERLPRYALPDRVEMHEAFPTTSSGKVDMQALAECAGGTDA